jgi:hypothetical protein
MVTCFEFSPQETSVTVWIGTSLISKEMAESNLKSEVLRRFSRAFSVFQRAGRFGCLLFSYIL